MMCVTPRTQHQIICHKISTVMHEMYLLLSINKI